MYNCAPSGTHLYTLMHPCKLSDTPWRTLAQSYTPVHSRLTCQTFGRICKFLNTLLWICLTLFKTLYPLRIILKWSFSQWFALVLLVKELHYMIGVWHSKNVVCFSSNCFSCFNLSNIQILLQRSGSLCLTGVSYLHHGKIISNSIVMSRIVQCQKMSHMRITQSHLLSISLATEY